jgi:hypothetical protein
MLKLFNKFLGKLTGYVVRPKILNESAATWSRTLSGPYFQLPRTCQIENLAGIYLGFFGEQPGNLLEIGGYDGFTYSNSWGLFDRGWSGWVVEPIQDYANQAKKNLNRFSGVKVVNAAIGKFKTNGIIHVLGPYSSIIEEQVKSVSNSTWHTGDKIVRQKEVKIITLDDLIQEQNIPKHLNLLIVDVEGYELEIFSQIDFKKFRPSMIIVELKDDEIDSHRSVRDLILRSSYTQIYRDHINSIFIDQIN